ncbi:unnamed protein product [Leptidea sinapis]|uniref:Uncharacterized protein n=1 Tax=Leptidea sinapis TaxID=189913 RepID=A0A5E4Q1Z3_9NEOP|nr:unnamed protein product [Leptidea sinapis]
MSMFIDYSF